ncbi:MAG: DUF4249 family protein [Bacteroidales bacterium]|nr:DUF4249 family protein [Bacteroidales bacterium]MBN2817517.1 DUF4249 family protein [Bacteroidales bacterium]
MNRFLNHTKQLAVYVAVLLISWSCTEIYTPEVITNQNLIYLEGGISDASEQYQIQLRNAVNFNSKPEFTAVENALVLVIENGTNEYSFEETGSGVYKSKVSDFIAKPGSSYQLVIETSDGNRYESGLETMPVNNAKIDSVYGFAEMVKLKYYNTYGEFIVKQEEVNQIYANIPSANENTYYRFDCQMFLEFISNIIVYPGTPQAETIELYMWESFFPDNLSILEANTNIDRIDKFPLSHTKDNKSIYDEYKFKFLDKITSVYDKTVSDTITLFEETDTGFVQRDSVIYGIPITLHDRNYYIGWIVYISQYSITRNAYTFWSDINRLESSEGEIFDPITTQLRGNMTCVTDDTKQMLGLFEVASKIITPAFVNYEVINGAYKGRLLNEAFPILTTGGWNDSIPPYFWVNKIVD